MLVAIFAVLLCANVGNGVKIAVAVLASLIVGVLLVALDVRMTLGILRDLKSGRPSKVLDAVDALLPGRLTARSKAPLLIYRAVALSLQGKWGEALEILGRIEHDGLPRIGNNAWRLFYLAACFDCFVFSKQLERARSLFQTRLEPLARSVGTGATEVLLDECRAILLFLDGASEEAQRLFAGLLDREDVPVVSVAYCQFFLGCIREERGDRSAADLCFEQARRLAPETFLPRSIDEVLARRPAPPPARGD
jgi:tetratricopeptide (TPR) repeat protein